MNDEATISPDLTVIVVNYNTGHLLHRMFAALSAAQQTLQLQLIVVDNASNDDSIEILNREYPEIELIGNRSNVGFGRANNEALPQIRAELVLLLNTDAFVSPNTLIETVAFMRANVKCGVLGVRLVSEHGALQPSCRYFPTPWNQFLAANGLQAFFPGARLVDNLDWGHDAVRNCDWVPGCYYLTRKSLLDEIGLFDPRYFLYFEEVDHCKRAQDAGWLIVFYPFVSVVHIGGESAKSEGSISNSGRQLSSLQIESELLFFRKHYGLHAIVILIFLNGLEVLFNLAKDMVHPRRFSRTGTALAKSRLSLKYVYLTRCGSHPTR